MLHYELEFTFYNKTHRVIVGSDIGCAVDALCVGRICNVCFKYEAANSDQLDPTRYAEIKPATCEQKELRRIKAEIARRYQEARANIVSRLRQAYKTTCLDMATFADKTTIKFNESYYHYTLAYYDRAGRVVKTVPPRGVSMDKTRTRASAPVQHEMATLFAYTSLGQLTSKIGPDVGKTTYRYDILGRLRSVRTLDFDPQTNVFTPEPNGGWTSAFKYDQNGNVLDVDRRAIKNGVSEFVDDLDPVQYVSDASNLVNVVSENATGVTGYEQDNTDIVAANSTADANGRVTVLENPTVRASKATYRHDDLPLSLTSKQVKMLYLRDALGRIVRQKQDGASTLPTYYTIPGDVTFDRALYYREGTADPSIREWGITGLGRIGVDRSVSPTHNGASYTRTLGNVYYELHDAQGSVRAVVKDYVKPDPTMANRYVAEVAATADYDAYGAWRFGRTTTMTEPYRYMWQGMRRPDGLDDPHMYITPFRLYDVRLGRWNTRDPIFNPSASPYEGMGSNPITYSDPLGLDITLLGDFGQAPHIRMGFDLLLRTPSYKAEFSQYVSIPGEGVFEFAGHKFYTAGMLKDGFKVIAISDTRSYGKLAFASMEKKGRIVTSFSAFTDDWDWMVKVMRTTLEEKNDDYFQSDLAIDVAIIILHEEAHNRLFENIVAALNDPKEAKRLFREYKETDERNGGENLHKDIARDGEQWKAIREKYEPQLVDAVLEKYPEFTREQAEDKVLKGFQRHVRLTATHNSIPISNPLVPNKK